MRGPLPGVSPGGSLSEARGSDKDDSNLSKLCGVQWKRRYGCELTVVSKPKKYHSDV